VPANSGSDEQSVGLDPRNDVAPNNIEILEFDQGWICFTRVMSNRRRALAHYLGWGRTVYDKEAR
jgi:hypothetical protein